MDLSLEFLSKLDVTNLLAMAGMLYLFKCNLDKKFEKIDKRFEDMDKKFSDKFVEVDKKFSDKLIEFDKKFDRIEEKVNAIDKRIVAIETILHMKECCLLKDQSDMKKAG